MSSLPVGQGEESLAAVSVLVRFDKGALIYRRDEAAGFVYRLREGAVKVYTTLPDRSIRGVAFHFPGDLFGFEEGRYTASADALTPVVVDQIPTSSLEKLISEDNTVALYLLRQMRTRLRQQQSHLLLLGRLDALGRVAMFIEMLKEWEQCPPTARRVRLYLPMLRAEIAEFVGLSLEAVSRAFMTLEAGEILKFSGKRHFEVIDRAGLKAVLAGTPAAGTTRQKAKRPLLRVHPRRANGS